MPFTRTKNSGRAENYFVNSWYFLTHNHRTFKILLSSRTASFVFAVNRYRQPFKRPFDLPPYGFVVLPFK